MCFPDLVNLRTVIIDPVYGSKTLKPVYEVQAYWEEDSSIQYGANGEPLTPNITVMLPANLNIRVGDKIELVEKAGVTLDPLYRIERTIKRCNPVGDYRISHYECML